MGMSNTYHEQVSGLNACFGGMSSPPGGRSLRRIDGGTPLLLLVCLVIFVDSLGYGVVVPVLPLYAKTLGIGDFHLGLLFATYAIALLAGSIPFGMLSDRFGRKPFVMFGMFAMAGAFVFYAFANTYDMLVIARILDGLTAAATWSAGLALIGEGFDEKVLGEKYGYVLTAMAAGSIAGPVIGGVLSDAAGYESPFIFIAALCLAGGIASLFLRERRLPRPGRPKRKRGEPAPPGALRVMLAPILGNRLIMLACLVTMITTVGFGLLEPMLPIRLSRTFDMSRTGIGLLFGVTMTFFGVLSPVVGRLSDRIGRKKLIVAGLVATAVVAPLLTVAPSVPLTYVLMGLYGVTAAFFATPSLPLITDNLSATGEPGENTGSLFGTAFGVMNLFWSLGYVLGPLLGGVMTGLGGLLSATLVYSFLLLALTVPVMKVLGNGKREQPPVRTA